MATPEGKIKAKVKHALAKLSCEYSFWPVQMGLGSVTLDCLLCAGGWFVAIETKAPGKKPTPRQERTIEAIRAAHGLVFVIDDNESLFLAMETIRACCNLAKEIR